jgi:hypothetical protein
MPPTPARPTIRPRPGLLDERQCAALTALLDRYADALPNEQLHSPHAAIPLLLHAVVGPQVRRIFSRQPVENPDEVTAALSLLRAARADLDALEGNLLHVAREKDAKGKRLLTFRQIAAALGVESEQAAQGRYQRKVGMPHPGGLPDEHPLNRQ